MNNANGSLHELSGMSIDDALAQLTTNDLILWSLSMVANGNITEDDIESACSFAVSGAPLDGLVKSEHPQLLRKKLLAVYQQLNHEFNP